jgi:hypothetical protein
MLVQVVVQVVLLSALITLEPQETVVTADNQALQELLFITQVAVTAPIAATKTKKEPVDKVKTPTEVAEKTAALAITEC